MLRIIILLLSVIAIVSAHLSISYPCADVSDVNGKDITIDVSNCDDTLERCPLYKGTTQTVRIQITPTKNTTNAIYQHVSGFVFGFDMPYGSPHPLCASAKQQDPRSCDGQSVGLIAGRTYTFEYPFVIEPWFPNLQLVVRFSCKDWGNKETYACIDLPVEILNAPSS